MRRVILVHFFAVSVFIAVFIYQPPAENLLSDLIFAAVSLEMGFVAQYSQKRLFRLLALFIWCFAYPHIFNTLIGLADLSWDSALLMGSEGTFSFFTYLAALVFTLIAAVLSFRLLLKSFKPNRYLYYFLLPFFALTTSFFIEAGRSGLLVWSEFISNPAGSFSQFLGQFASLNIPSILGLTFIQLMLLILLGDD